ncbi:MAG: hypothetical protein M3Q97_10365, partial [Bacteroidota bacterium]|nr:hypothetical protein [Bacteroidota bacterium]
MRVDPGLPYSIIFSIYTDSELGAVLEPYAVQLSQQGQPTLSYQKLYSHTMQAFLDQIRPEEAEIINLTTEYSPEVITRKFSKGDLRPHEFFERMTDKLYKESIRPYIETRLNKCMGLLTGKAVYQRGKSGNPAQHEVTVIADRVSVHFHFVRDDEGTLYYPTFRCGEEKLTFVGKDVQLITQQPCVLLADGKLYFFEDSLDGIKFTPFFRQWNIHIPKSSEPEYYKRFVTGVIEKHTVLARGFKIHHIEAQPVPVITLRQGWNNQPQLILQFDYEREKVHLSDERKIIVKFTREGENYVYYKISRNTKAERAHTETLETFGLKKLEGSVFGPHDKEISWPELISYLGGIQSSLAQAGFRIEQDTKGTRYFLGEAKTHFRKEEKNDWFDVYAEVVFGEYKFPFYRLRKYILSNIHEFPLPDGSVAILPDAWFS